MRGMVGSLNAAVAGSILLFEASVQRDPAGTAAPPAGSPPDQEPQAEPDVSPPEAEATEDAGTDPPAEDAPAASADDPAQPSDAPPGERDDLLPGGPPSA